MFLKTSIKSSAKYQYPLDQVTNLPTMWLSFHQGSREFEGEPCADIWRSSDESTETFVYKNGKLDLKSILAFVGVGSGSLTRWYDPISGFDLHQETAGRRPQLV